MRKPLSIVLISVLFLISPVAILVFNAALSMVPLVGYGSILSRLPLYDIIILVLYPVCALSIWMVKKWGWWVLISSALIMILYNIAALFFNPFASALLVLAMNGALFFVALLFFRRHLIAPYFHPRLRWWEQDQRYEIDIYLKFLGMDRNVIISDISRGGCYLFADFLIDVGVEVPVLIVCGSFHISLHARVMRIARETEKYYGYGLMFLKVDDVQKEGLDHLIERLREAASFDNDGGEGDERRSSRRFIMSFDLALEWGGHSQPVKLSDISKSGCAVGTNMVLDTGTRCRLHFIVNQVSHSVGCHVVWKRKNGDMYLYGLQFSSLSREDRASMKKLIKSVRKLGGKKRELHIDDYYRMCEEEAEDTPYRLISKLKKIT
ncbi:PilZ domain-containing protein [Spirochaeta isovalerica]|uniref:C-di-GMP-binding flagellar brake protein YcgR n=1 Tax=Spirochaeta isovalerica TaxID=150 RepID=A0A841R5H3_9SPIO|nr:PilZ domain-containing protein [Spirochaeta isovalerica]MBB6479076.1 c-di-GMP-binding flagellar brake protein YcgR [Spirochaeta isovalerica]